MNLAHCKLSDMEHPAKVVLFMAVDVLTGLVFLMLIATSSVHAAEPFSGSVKKIIDGDSLLIHSGGKYHEVRLYGIDCPEYNQPFASVAKELLKKRIKGQKVLVRPEYYDTYKRLVAIVEYEGQTVNGHLVLSGLAWVYPYFCRKEICASWKEMEISAREAKRGLWSAAHPVPPWQWKRMKHGS